MRVTSVETTPNPNSMKIGVASPLVDRPVTYSRDRPEGAPDPVSRLLAIEGIRSVFLSRNFLTLSKEPGADWDRVLPAAMAVFEADAPVQRRPPESPFSPVEHGADQEVRVSVQTFRDIPIQVKATAGPTEGRAKIHERFNEAAQHAVQTTATDFIKERHWVPRGTRYGTPDEVARMVAAEIDALIDDASLSRLRTLAAGQTPPALPTESPATPETLRLLLRHDDWRVRLRAVQGLGTDEAAISLLVEAIKDPDPRIRRGVAGALGATGSPRAVGPLCDALSDPSVGVRRTAGDALSDIGDPSAEPAICRSLTDPSKLVRWRAARFLNEVGTPAALPQLRALLQDPEFEVRMEAQAAIDRIDGGGETKLPAWKRMTSGRS